MNSKMIEELKPCPEAELRHWFFQKINPEQRKGFLFAAGVAPLTCDLTLGMQYQAIDRIAAAITAYDPDKRLREALERIAELEAQLNTPEVDDFAKGAALEAAHQRERWGADHDAGKTPFDWFWLVGYLAQKAATAAVAGDSEKAKHHTISTAAALANWHLALSGADTRMRAGIGPGNGGDKVGSAYDLASKIDAALSHNGE